MRQYQSSSRRLNENSPFFRLYQKAKRLGQWDPRSIDFSRDRQDFQNLPEESRMALMAQVSQFIAGEEAVTLDISPMLIARGRHGSIEEQMYLTTFVFEEAKHVEFFDLWLRSVGLEQEDLNEMHPPPYKVIFEANEKAMHRLLTDDSPEAVVRASTIYNMVVEGVLAETGYDAFGRMFKEENLMPGLLRGIDYLKQDESRHIAYGTYLLQSLVAEDRRLYEVFESQMDEMLPHIKEFIGGGEEAPSEEPNPALEYALRQFELRKEKVARALGQGRERLEKMAEEEFALNE